MSNDEQACGFCEKTAAEVERLATAAICNECLALCRDMIAERD